MQGYVEMTGVDSDTSQDIAEAISLKGGRWDQNQFLYLKSDLTNWFLQYFSDIFVFNFLSFIFIIWSVTLLIINSGLPYCISLKSAWISLKKNVPVLIHI